jgi:proline iminopeptidase
VLKEITVFEAAGDFTNPRYTELLFTHFYPKHVLRFLLDQWPNLVNRSFVTLNHDLYVNLQGPSKFGVAGDVKLKDLDIKDQLSNITVPSLSKGGTHDIMHPKHMDRDLQTAEPSRNLFG